jgi:hypothetical protein
MGESEGAAEKGCLESAEPVAGMHCPCGFRCLEYPRLKGRLFEAFTADSVLCRQEGSKL